MFEKRSRLRADAPRPASFGEIRREIHNLRTSKWYDGDLGDIDNRKLELTSTEKKIQHILSGHNYTPSQEKMLVDWSQKIASEKKKLSEVEELLIQEKNSSFIEELPSYSQNVGTERRSLKATKQTPRSKDWQVFVETEPRHFVANNFQLAESPDEMLKSAKEYAQREASVLNDIEEESRVVSSFVRGVEAQRREQLVFSTLRQKRVRHNRPKSASRVSAPDSFLFL